jgi:RES domain-containing protein
VTPLPPPLGGAEFVAWRLDRDIYAPTWDSGEGAFRAGGRWNSRGLRAVYCSIDPGTTILELAVHKGFDTLDTVPHVLTSLRIRTPAALHVLHPAGVPNPAWLTAGTPSGGQQRFGDALLARHGAFLIPSVVSTESWNLVFLNPTFADYDLRSQDRFALDTRLNPP